MEGLIQKYNVPGPRYTSYPTVPFWDNDPTVEEWENLTKEAFKISNSSEGVSIYIHLPFCESLCTFCGCNKRITVNHKVEEPYLETVLKEWEMYLSLFNEKPIIKEIHLGGGTPTFFSPENLKDLITRLLTNTEKHPEAEFSFEAHPKNTTKKHLQTLYDLGFRRLSLGVQDFDPKVQEIINRIQPFEMVEKAVLEAREIGYTSISLDLVYGLPFQQLTSVKNTIEKVNLLRPERIAFYSYAHVPWTSPGQRRFTKIDLPKDEEKRALYELGKAMFEENGYIEIGMDHFSLPTDGLFKAFENKTLHRNFMGYSSDHTTLMVGLGVSSISDSWTSFAQNVKTVEEYQSIVNEGKLPVYRGHKLNAEDLILRQHILNLMCHFETSWKDKTNTCEALLESLPMMSELIEDGLVIVKENSITVTEKGIPFIRNICMTLDARLWRSKPETNLFSSTV